jgi:hypothetical protein
MAATIAAGSVAMSLFFWENITIIFDIQVINQPKVERVIEVLYGVPGVRNTNIYNHRSRVVWKEDGLIQLNPEVCA